MKVRPIIPKLGIRYGIAGGLLAVLSFVVFYYLDQQPWRNLVSFLLDIVIVGFFCVLPIREFKVRYNRGELRFYHGMSIGFLSYVFIGIIYSLFIMLFVLWIEPGYFELYKSVQLEEIEGMKELIMSRVKENPEQFYQQQLDGIKEITKGSLIFDAFVKKVIIGLFLTPIFSIVLRTQRPK
ncbi:DUF4199 domain-containing protein [Roseivirga thermotolerans]|uniref:DUF4199 domain-containing protein n=1 Tax=Roseivirga thermotolerans TaxID=1758176 RepID=A0ABQ3I8H3_9BACT|nr:DUF4199 domain-containing protein [Roseivirga thermotolerans]GHE64690.1 hypothetical protein GCM10011340_19560 [Roseivirga thermotolerans]